MSTLLKTVHWKGQSVKPLLYLLKLIESRSVSVSVIGGHTQLIKKGLLLYD